MIITENEWRPALLAIKKYIPFSILLFLISFLGGVLFVNFYPLLAKESFREVSESFSFLFNFGPAQMGIFIFLNNTVKVFLFMLLGVLFVVPTIFFLVLNGWILGVVVALFYPLLGMEGLFFSLFLHGFFEFLALFIGASLGIWLGVSFCRETRKKKTKVLPLSPEMKKVFFPAVGVFIRLVVPLLFLAAVIETFIIFFYNH